MKNPQRKSDWGKKSSDSLGEVLTQFTVFLVATSRNILKNAGIWGVSLLDIGFGGIVWSLVIMEEAKLVLPAWLAYGIGFLISLVMTQAQIFFNEKMFEGKKWDWNAKNVWFYLFNVLLTTADTLVDASLAVFLFLGRSPMDFIEVVKAGVPGMFWVYTFIIAAISMFGDMINIYYLADHNKATTHRKDNTYAPTIQQQFRQQEPPTAGLSRNHRRGTPRNSERELLPGPGTPTRDTIKVYRGLGSITSVREEVPPYSTKGRKTS